MDSCWLLTIQQSFESFPRILRIICDYLLRSDYEKQIFFFPTFSCRAVYLGFKIFVLFLMTFLNTKVSLCSVKTPRNEFVRGNGG